MFSPVQFAKLRKARGRIQRLDEAIAAHPDIPPQFQERYNQIRRAYNRAQASNDAAGMISQGENASDLRRDMLPSSTSSTSTTQTVQPPSATTASVGPAFPASSRGQHRTRRGQQQLSYFLGPGAVSYPGPAPVPTAPYIDLNSNPSVNTSRYRPLAVPSPANPYIVAGPSSPSTDREHHRERQQQRAARNARYPGETAHAELLRQHMNSQQMLGPLPREQGAPPSADYHFPPLPPTSAPNPFTPQGLYASLPPPPGQGGFYQHGSFSTAAISPSSSGPDAPHGRRRLRMSSQTFGPQDHSSSSGSGHDQSSVYSSSSGASRGDSRNHSSYSLQYSDAASYEENEAEGSASRRSAKGKGKDKAGRR
uniref:J domain-containing protein n=1 Tax=Mycena chlorophos TaxID=658473 RepID=A0ABQ0LBU1_MYCCL|nr:predicted protein [Mycena chlorophos]